jgi:hypothetical protein
MLNPQTISWLIGVGLVGITTIIQSLPIKYKPWSWLFSQIGKAVNSEVLNEVNDIKNTVKELQQDMEDSKSENEKERALDARRRILRFADECKLNIKHSEEYFNNVLEDIDFYKDYCDLHPKFENEKAVIAISIIEKIYKHAYETNDFL